MPEEIHPPICDYEGSDYQTRFWEKGGREYEDRSEAIALERLLPKRGDLLLELGAGAGRNTTRYNGFHRVILLDYSRTQLKQAQERLGPSDRYIYVAADIYKLPFIDNLFDAATMIRVIHHMADAPKALQQIQAVMQPGAAFILEYANKRNWKSVLRYVLRRQKWSPFTREPVEFIPLNYDFHPKYVHQALEAAGFREEKVLSVSHFRVGVLKRNFSPTLLASLDSLLQWTGAFIQFSPSIFIRSKVAPKGGADRSKLGEVSSFFKCPECGHSPLVEYGGKISCPACDREWNITEGIYDFRGE